MRDFLIDTDTASDDAVALLMAFAAPDVRVVGLTTVAGNVGLEQATRNALTTAISKESGIGIKQGSHRPSLPGRAMLLTLPCQRCEHMISTVVITHAANQA